MGHPSPKHDLQIIPSYPSLHNGPDSETQRKFMGGPARGRRTAASPDVIPGSCADIACALAKEGRTEQPPRPDGQRPCLGWYGLPPEPDREKSTDSQYDAQEKRSCRYNLAPCCSSLEPRPVRLRAAALAPPCPIPRSDPLLSPCSPPHPIRAVFPQPAQAGLLPHLPGDEDVWPTPAKFGSRQRRYRRL